MTASATAFMFSSVLAMCAVAQTSQPSRPGDDPLAAHRAEQQVFAVAMAKAAPCVVTIETIGGTQPGAAAPGSEFIVGEGPTTGVVYSSDGLILTSEFNFVRDPSVITVILPDGRRVVGELLARDEVRRLAMLKIDATDLPTPAWVTDETQVRVGQWALALGRGFGTGAGQFTGTRPGGDPSLSVGIVSGLNRASGLVVQTDAKLSPANFGGPLIDLEGRVLGICVPVGLSGGQMAGVEWYDSGLGFAIPYRQLSKSARDLAVGHNLRRGLLGIAVEPRTKDGVGVLGIADPSPARLSGMQVGDVIVAIDGEPVKLYFDLRRIMRARLAGEWITVRVKRGPREIDLQLVLAVPEDLGAIPRTEPEPKQDNDEPDPAKPDQQQ